MENTRRLWLSCRTPGAPQPRKAAQPRRGRRLHAGFQQEGDSDSEAGAGPRGGRAGDAKFAKVLVLAELTESFKQVCEARPGVPDVPGPNSPSCCAQAIRSAAELVAPVSSTSEHLAVVPQPTAFASCRPDSRPQSASALPAPSASCHQAPLMSGPQLWDRGLKKLQSGSKKINQDQQNLIRIKKN